MRFLIITFQSIFAFFVIKVAAQKDEINIGAFFLESEIDVEKSFLNAIEMINEIEDINFHLIPYVKRLTEADGSVALHREACGLIKIGVIAIFGPSSKVGSDVVSLVCNNTGIPHILFDLCEEEETDEKVNHQMTINVFPNQLMLSKAYADIVNNFAWRKFTIIYDADDETASKRLQDLLQLRDIHNDLVRVRQFKRTDDFRLLWKNIKNERRFVLDCNPDLLVDVLNASISFDLMGERSHLFLTNLETHTAGLADLWNNGNFKVNVTAARLMMNEMATDDFLLSDLIMDAVLLFASAIQNVTSSYPVDSPRLDCDSIDYNTRSWDMRKYIIQIMKSTSGNPNITNFRTSNLQFDEEGQRVNFNIELYEPLTNNATAYWDTKGHITHSDGVANAGVNLTFRISTKTGAPYFMINETAKNLNKTGNDLYEGYVLDLMQEIAKEMNFNYIFIPVKDNQYGKEDKDTKQWNGVIGELINGDAEMGIGDLTITQARKQVVDFTVPFMQLGIGILAYKKPTETTAVLSFMQPFVWNVWLYVMIAIFIMIFLLVFVARVSKMEWQNPHPCNRDAEVVENQWHIQNTLWLTMGSIMTAGSDILPRSPPMRALNSMWWIFAIIIANSYTANLAAFLYNQQNLGTINSINDLAGQEEIKFGTIEEGSTYNFFKESNETTYRVAFNTMNQRDASVYTKNNEDGRDLVLQNGGSYMFLMETTTIEYYLKQYSTLRSVGEKFSEKHYAIAVPMGAEYRSQLSVAILKLSERGVLFQLKKKWWRNPNETAKGDVEDSDSGDGSDADLNLEEVRGIFYTLAIGVFLAIIIGFSEFAMHVQNIALEEKTSFKEAFQSELPFVLNIWNNKKPVRGTPTSSVKTISRRSSERTVRSAKENNFIKTNESSEEF